MDTSRSFALIPWDDRPDHLHLPVHLAHLAGRQAVLPPRGLLSWGTSPGQPAALGEWLKQQTAAEAVLVAADMLAYGGAMACSEALPESTVRTHLAPLEALREAAPQVPILVFSSLVPRGAPLMATPAPSDLTGRQALHHRLIEYLAEGVIDYLLLAEGETCPSPLQTSPWEALWDLATSRGVNHRLGMLPGLVAAAPMLLTRVVLQSHPSPLHVAMRFPAPPASEEASRRLVDLAQSYLPILGARPCPDWEKADLVLFVHSRWEALPAAQDSGQDYPLQAPGWLGEVATALAQRTSVAIADVASPQGADPLLLEELVQYIELPHLAAYAGKGPIGDRLGWALAQGCLAAAARRQAQEAQHDFRQQQLPLVLQRQFQQMTRLLQAEKILILLLDSNRKRLTPLSIAHGFGPEELTALEFAADARFWSLALALKSFRLEAEEPGDWLEIPEVLATLGARNGVMVSLLSRYFRQDLLLEEERPMGLLCVLNKRRGTFTEEDETLLTLLARQTSAILRNVRYSETELELQEANRWLPRAQAQQQLLITRLLEDWGYQTVVRPWLEQHLPEGTPLWNLGRCHQAMEIQMREQLGTWAQGFLARHWCKRDLPAPFRTYRVRLPEQIPCRFSLPWPCTSEIEVDVSLTLEAIPVPKTGQ